VVGITLFFACFFMTRAVSAQSTFRPGFKEAICKLESGASESEIARIGLGLRYSAESEKFLKKVKSDSFRFTNVEVGLAPQESGVYFYWRPTKNHLFLFGYSNSCLVSEGLYKPGSDRKSKIVYSDEKKGCCLVYQESTVEVVATPLSAMLGKRADDLRNTGYIMGWYNRKDCSEPTTSDPDFVQSFIPGSGEPSLSALPDGPVEGLLRPINMGAPNPLRISSAHGGEISGTCKVMSHTFSLRPPPEPFPRFDALPPFPKRKDYRAFDEEKDFLWEPRE
jgi:hypothetical protein